MRIYTELHHIKFTRKLLVTSFMSRFRVTELWCEKKKFYPINRLIQIIYAEDLKVKNQDFFLDLLQW